MHIEFTHQIQDPDLIKRCLKRCQSQIRHLFLGHKINYFFQRQQIRFYHDQSRSTSLGRISAHIRGSKNALYLKLLENEKSKTSSYLQYSHFKLEVILEFSKPWLHISPSCLCSTLFFLIKILPQQMPCQCANNISRGV